MKLRISDFGSNGGHQRCCILPRLLLWRPLRSTQVRRAVFFAFFRKQKLWICGSRKSSLKAPLHPFTVDSDTLDSSAKAFFRRGEANAQIHCNALFHPPRMSILYSQKILFLIKKILLRKNFFSQDSRCQILYSHCKNLHYAWDLHR